MAFEKFTRKAAALTKTPVVGIQKRGTFSLNASAMAHLRQAAGNSDDDGDQLLVELLYDRDEQLIGFRPTDDEVEGYYIRKQAAAESYLLSGRAFTQHYQIETSVLRRYKARLQDDILVIDLKEHASK